MADTIIRILAGPGPETNTIGLSGRACFIEQKPEFGEFMVARGYDWRLAQVLVSYDFIEVQPPLSTEHTKEFAALIMNGIVDAAQDDICIIDNRILGWNPNDPCSDGEQLHPPQQLESQSAEVL